MCVLLLVESLIFLRVVCIFVYRVFVLLVVWVDFCLGRRGRLVMFNLLVLWLGCKGEVRFFKLGVVVVVLIVVGDVREVIEVIFGELKGFGGVWRREELGWELFGGGGG